MSNNNLFLSFDFGDGETVASFFDGEKSIHCYFDRAQHQKLYSHVFRTGEDYSLTSGDTLLINLKKRLLSTHKKFANKNDARILQAEADFKGFVRCVVDAVLKNNAININDCVLLYAYPSSFYANSEKQNKELESIYKSIIESVLMDFKPKEIRSVDEAEASFYCKGSSERNCLVIDAGSATLDFALFVHGEKIALSSVQNSSLGASVIEENLYNYFLTNGTFAEDARKIESAYSVNLHDYFVRVLRERKEKAYTTGQFQKLGSYELSVDLPFIEPKYDSDFNFKLKDDFNSLSSVLTYRKDVRNAILKAKCEADSVPEMKGQIIDQVILCGGAALMGWLQDDVREIFSDHVDIQHLDASDLQHDPSFTVADGLLLHYSGTHSDSVPEKNAIDYYLEMQSELRECERDRHESLEKSAYTGVHSWDIDSMYDHMTEQIYEKYMPSLLNFGYIPACKDYYDFLSKNDQIKADKFVEKYLQLHSDRSRKDLTSTPIWDHCRQIVSPDVQFFGDTLKKVFGK